MRVLISIRTFHQKYVLSNMPIALNEIWIVQKIQIDVVSQEARY